ncbi:MAG: chemotaxis protein CheC [Tissierella sp.]|uniref:chemotaxis protein CheC n=1 Tax=Tissierella sp. TaxID=41274 RepID=UPI003F9E17FF
MIDSKYTPLQIDCLKEVVNIGGGNAATSLSKLLNKRIDMTVPIIEVLSYEEVYKNIMAEDKVINSVIMNMLGDGEGIFVFVASEEATSDLAKMMMRSDEDMSEEIENSALVELVNITVSSFLNAISKMIDANLITSIPLQITDMFGAVLSSVYMETEYYDENIMIIKNEFSYNGNKIDTSLYFVPRPGVLENLFKTLGV